MTIPMLNTYTKKELINKFNEGYYLYLDLLGHIPDFAKIGFLTVNKLIVKKRTDNLSETTYGESTWDKFKDSLKRLGTYWVAMIDIDNTVIEGSHRVKALQEIDLSKKILCIKRDEVLVVATKINEIVLSPFVTKDWILCREPDQFEQEMKKRFFKDGIVIINYYNDYENVLHRIVRNLGRIDTILRTKYNYEVEPAIEINKVGYMWGNLK